MKVAFIGNTCNAMFGIAEAVREASAEIDAHLYLPDNVDFQQMPESENPELKNEYPSWIHKGEEWRITNTYRVWGDNLINELKKYDAVVLSEIFVSLSPYLKKAKTAFLTLGSDLTAAPFYEINSTYLKPTGLKQKLKLRVISFSQTRGIAEVDEIWTQPFSPFQNALKRLNVEKERIKDNMLYVVIDKNRFRPHSEEEIKVLPFYREVRERFKFTVFHPSRFMFDVKETRSFAHNKNNTILLYGFADFVKKYKIADAGLVLIDRTYSNDMQKAKELIMDLDIESNVFWLKPKSEGGFSRNQMALYYSMFSCGADDFGAGWFGAVALESLATGKPTLNYIDKDAIKKLYSWHPFCSTNTIEGVSQMLHELYINPQKCVEIGYRSRKWIEQYHSKKVLGVFYANELERLITGK